MKTYDNYRHNMRDKLISWNMKTKTVKVYGPWVNGNQTVREISLEAWNSYTPLNRQAQRLKEMYEAAEAVGSTDGEEIYDFGCEC
jgi:hypothetical protein